MATFSTRLTLRRRVAVSCAVAMVTAVALTAWGTYLWHHVQTVRRTVTYYGYIGDPTRASSARWGLYRSAGVGVLVLALGLLVCGLLARWSLLPLRGMTATLTRFGPANLGQRTRLGGPRDELRQLGDAVDEMLDRFTAGYEGQRMFAANASHELRTPLALQRTLIEVSMARALTPDQVALVTRQLLHANERNEALIEGLLVLTESDRGVVGSELVVLDRMVGEVVANHRDLADEAGVTLHASLAECVVRGERVLLERLVTNLVQNAIKYNEDDGRVDITLTAGRVFTVANTGEPVPRELVGRLFEPFRRLTSDRVTPVDGAGLGLAIVRSIARAHDASLTAHPRVGGGLRVEVEFVPVPG